MGLTCSLLPLRKAGRKREISGFRHGLSFNFQLWPSTLPLLLLFAFLLLLLVQPLDIMLLPLLRLLLLLGLLLPPGLQAALNPFC